MPFTKILTSLSSFPRQTQAVLQEYQCSQTDGFRLHSKQKRTSTDISGRAILVLMTTADTSRVTNCHPDITPTSNWPNAVRFINTPRKSNNLSLKSEECLSENETFITLSITYHGRSPRNWSWWNNKENDPDPKGCRDRWEWNLHTITGCIILAGPRNHTEGCLNFSLKITSDS